MISRQLRATFYFCCGPVMRLNGWSYRNLRAPKSGSIKVHLGPGQHNYLDGWINVDANIITAKCDVWADLRNRLPFRSNTVDAFYSHHVIEHLPDSRLEFHFREIHRCLKSGGVFRIGGPNGDVAMKRFAAGDISWFSSDFPDKRSSLGGRLANFLLCRGEHLTILTFSYFQEITAKAGFKHIHLCTPVTDTSYPDYFDRKVLNMEWESTPLEPHTLIIEGQKE